MVFYIASDLVDDNLWGRASNYNYNIGKSHRNGNSSRSKKKWLSSRDEEYSLPIYDSAMTSLSKQGLFK